jgi:pimeloyl-ACP methyl ester carboxylesterase
MLPDGKGTASDDLARAADLHNAGMNVLLFDYRGFGMSAGAHPSDAWMQEDSEHALSYVESKYGVHANEVVVYGDGAGASLATLLCGKHPELPALILEAADGDFAEQASRDERSRLVPFRLLFHEDFALASPLHELATPKLLISHTGGHPPVVYQRAATPKTMLDLPAGATAATLHDALTRFLDSYVASAAGQTLR